MIIMRRLPDKVMAVVMSAPTRKPNAVVTYSMAVDTLLS